MAAAGARGHKAIYLNRGFAINQTQFRDGQLGWSRIVVQLKPAGTKPTLPPGRPDGCLSRRVAPRKPLPPLGSETN